MVFDDFDFPVFRIKFRTVFVLAAVAYNMIAAVTYSNYTGKTIYLQVQTNSRVGNADTNLVAQNCTQPFDKRG